MEEIWIRQIMHFVFEQEEKMLVATFSPFTVDSAYLQVVFVTENIAIKR